MRRARLLVLIALTGCAVNPATGRRELSLIGEGREVAIGREADADVTASLGLVDDPALQSYVTELGARLSGVSERPELPWSFRVVDDPVVNAFALPGGFIYVTRGILTAFDSEAELVGVLGHEIGHVTARHSVSQMSRQQIQQIGLGVGMVFSEDLRRFGGVLGAGLQLMNLRNSRGDETQADELGLRYLSRTAFDPEAMIGVFQMLASVSGGEGRIPEWQLTHPYPENREAHIRELIAAGGIQPGGEVGRDRYLDRIEGLVYGENPREGFFVEDRFVHPDLAFDLHFPPGWKGVNQRTVVGAVSPGEDGVVMLQLVPGATDPAAELRTFLAQEGVSAGAVRNDDAPGVVRRRATFGATADSGALRGEVAYIGFDGRVFQIVAYAASARWGAYSAAAARTLSSFARLTDAGLLATQPQRLRTVRLTRATSLRSWIATNPGPLGLDELARLNRVTADAVLPAGTRIKRVQ